MHNPLDRRVQQLLHVPLFRRLKPPQLQELARSASILHLEAGRELFRKGEAGRHCYGVLEGRVKVVVAAPSGKQVLFNILDQGEFFGELALLAGGFRTASVSALEDTALLMVERREFLHLLRSEPELPIDLLSTLAERLADVSEVVEDNAFLTIRARLAKKLLALADVPEGDQTTHWPLPSDLRQTDLAAMVNATRESVNKQLHAWDREGIVSIERGTITIRRADELERLAGLLNY